jgi:hypothetical protein
VGVGFYAIIMGLFAGEGLALYLRWMDQVMARTHGSLVVTFALGLPVLSFLLFFGHRFANWILFPLERRLIRMEGAKARIGYT